MRHFNMSNNSMRLLFLEMEKLYREHFADRKSIATLCVELNNNILKGANNGNLTYDEGEMLQSYNMQLWSTYRNFKHELASIGNEYRNALPDESKGFTEIFK